MLITLLPVLASNLAAANSAVKTTTGTILDVMVAEFGEKSRLLMVQTMSNLIQFGSGNSNNAVNNIKVKASLIEKLLGKCEFQFLRSNSLLLDRPFRHPAKDRETCLRSSH